MTVSQRNQLSDNPIRVILTELGTSNKIVTIDYLKQVSDTFARSGLKFATYGQVFDMLKFLEARGCITIQETRTGEYNITGLYNYGI